MADPQASSAIPPLPAGFTLDAASAAQPANGMPPLPAGFTLDSAPAPKQTALGAAQAGASGVNAGVADVAGLPVDTANNVLELGKVGAGFLWHEATGNPIPDALMPTDPATIPGTSAWIKQKLRNVGAGDVVDTAQPTTLNKYIHAGAEAVPGAELGGEGGTVGAIKAATAGATAGAAQQGAADAGLGTGNQVAIGLLAGAATGRATQGRVAPDGIAEAAQETANKAAAANNAGAAATPVDVKTLTAETQAELARIGASNGTVNPVALSRVAEAESLPTPVRLTAGQARGDAAAISDEFNKKGQNNNAIGNRYDEQDQALKDNLATLHRDAAPDTVANNPIQNGQAIIDSLKRYDQPKVAAINSAYDAAKAANGGNLQMDASNFATDATDALKPQGRARFLPASVQGIIDDTQANGGQMSLDDFEGARTALANESRKAQISGDSNAVTAIGKVRDALENVQPADSTAANAKALYDNARGLARQRFAALDADPAYAAAVGDDTPIGRQSDLADKFTDKYVLGGSKAALQRLRLKLDDEGQQAMTSTAMNYLQGRAGINPDTGAGRFSNAGYNTALTKITPKAQELLGDQDLIGNLRKVGNIASYTQAQSRGSYANTSHTFVAGAVSKGAALAEHAVNVAAKGLPVGTIARKFLESRSQATAIHNVLKAGAGLED